MAHWSKFNSDCLRRSLTAHLPPHALFRLTFVSDLCRQCYDEAGIKPFAMQFNFSDSKKDKAKNLARLTASNQERPVISELSAVRKDDPVAMKRLKSLSGFIEYQRADLGPFIDMNLLKLIGPTVRFITVHEDCDMVPRYRLGELLRLTPKLHTLRIYLAVCVDSKNWFDEIVAWRKRRSEQYLYVGVCLWGMEDPFAFLEHPAIGEGLFCDQSKVLQLNVKPPVVRKSEFRRIMRLLEEKYADIGYSWNNRNRCNWITIGLHLDIEFSKNSPLY